MNQLIVLILALVNSSLFASDFKLSDIPKGKEITLPNPASTQASPYSPFYVAATDRDQTIKLSLEGGYARERIKIGLYDKNLEKAVYFTLTKNSPVVYSFKSIDRIRIIPKPRKDVRIRSKIIVESNRPLTIGH